MLRAEGGRPGQDSKAYLVVLVPRVHPVLAFLLRDDLAGVLDDDLVGRKGPVAPDAVAAVGRLDHLDADVVFPARLAPFLQILEAAVRARLRADAAVVVVAFVEHQSVETVVVAAARGLADAGRVFVEFGVFPDVGGLTDEYV